MAGRFFDVAVVTEGINGLLAAYELSKSDVSIVVFDNYNPSLAIDGYVFNYYPGHIFAYSELPGMFKELRVTFETYTSPMYQIILPDRRVDVYSDTLKLLSSVRLRFNGGSPALTEYLHKNKIQCDLLHKLGSEKGTGMQASIRSLLRGIPYRARLTREKRNAAGSISRLGREKSPSVFVNAISRYLLPWADDSIREHAACTPPPIPGKRFYPAGGMDSLKNALLQELARRNVNVIQDKEINSIEYRKYFTVTFDHEQSVRARSIVAEPIYEKTLSLLPGDPYRKIRKKFYVDNIFAGLHRSCLPEIYDRVNNAVLVHDYEEPLENDNLLFIDSNPVSDIKRAKDEMAALTLTLLIRENSMPKISALRQSAIGHLKRFMPFFDDYAEHIYFTDPSLLWDNTGVPVYRKGILLLNNEFLHMYTPDTKYAYLKKQVKKLIANL